MEWKGSSRAYSSSGRSSLAGSEESLDELAELAHTAGAEVIGRSIQTRVAPEAATLIGQGKVEQLTAEVPAGGIDVVIFDHDLTPTQQRNLEKALACKVIDRTQLILDIFAARARTREGRLQVELAQLNYLRPRLSGHGVEMSRLGGGIGTRGPGETKLEATAGAFPSASRKWKMHLPASAPAAPFIAAAAAPFRSLRWPWPAIPTPANPRFSTASRNPV